MLPEHMRDALDAVAVGCDRERYFNQHHLRYEQLLGLVWRRCKSGRCLDVGAAPGHVSMALSLAGYDVVSVVYDLDEDWENTRAVDRQFAARAKGLPLSLIRCDVQQEPLPLDGDAFDCVVFTEVLEHLWMFPARVLSEIHRVLKPGGYVFLTTPNATQLTSRLKWLVGRTSYTSLDTMLSLPVHMRHNREYTRSEVEVLLRGTGFTVEVSRFEEPYGRCTKLPGEQRFEDRLCVNSPRSIAKLVSLGIKAVWPAMRSGLAVVGRKSDG